MLGSGLPSGLECVGKGRGTHHCNASEGGGEVGMQLLQELQLLRLVPLQNGAALGDGHRHLHRAPHLAQARILTHQKIKWGGRSETRLSIKKWMRLFDAVAGLM